MQLTPLAQVTWLLRNGLMRRLEHTVELMLVPLKVIVDSMKRTLLSPSHDNMTRLRLLTPHVLERTTLAPVHEWIRPFMLTLDSILRVTLIQQPPIHVVETLRLLSPGLTLKVEHLVLWLTNIKTNDA